MSSYSHTSLPTELFQTSIFNVHIHCISDHTSKSLKYLGGPVFQPQS